MGFTSCCDWFYVTMAALFVSFGAFTCGYSIGATNGIQNFNGFLEYFGLGNSSGNASCTRTSDIDDYGNFILGTFTSFITLGGGIGSLLAARPVDLLGRKLTIVLSAALMVLGTVLQSSAAHGAVWMLLLGRLIAGVGFGSYYLAGPLYLAEMSPKKVRGMLTSFIGPGVMLGIIFAHVTNNFLFDKPFGWRVSRLSISLLSIIFLVGMLFLPRTPRWLMLKGREHEANEVLKGRLFSKSRAGMIEEIKEILHSENKSFLQELKLLLRWNNLKRLLPCLPVHFFSAACGSFVFYYSEALFCSLGMTPFIGSIISSVVSFLGTVSLSVFIDKLGRKPMLVGGGMVLAVIAVLAATFVYVYNLEDEFHPVVSYAVTALICLFLLVYAASWAVISWVVTGEVFPLEGRGVSTALSVCMNWFTIYLFTQTFPFILASLRVFGTLYMLGIINLSAGVYYLLLFPETKGISLEAMEKLFAKPWLERVGLCQCSKSRLTKASTGDSIVNPVVVSKANGVTDLSTEPKFPVEQSKEWEDYILGEI